MHKSWAFLSMYLFMPMFLIYLMWLYINGIFNLNFYWDSHRVTCNCKQILHILGPVSPNVNAVQNNDNITRFIYLSICIHTHTYTYAYKWMKVAWYKHFWRKLPMCSQDWKLLASRFSVIFVVSLPSKNQHHKRAS